MRRITTGLLCAAVAAAGLAVLIPSPASAAGAPTVEDLRQTGSDQQRWLTVPSSRIVLNPNDFDHATSQVEQSGGPDLPLDAGYYVRDRADRLPNLLTVDQRPASIGWVDDFATLDPGWQPDPGVSLSSADGRLTATLAANSAYPWGAVSRTVELDVDAYRAVQANVVGGTWSVKVDDGSGDRAVIGDNSQQGLVTGVLPADWHGTKRFTLRAYVIGRGTTLTLDRIEAHHAPTATNPVGWRDEFDKNTDKDHPIAPGWDGAEAGVSAHVSSGQLELSLADGAPNNWGALYRQVQVNVDAYRTLQLEVSGTRGAWSAKVNDGGTDLALIPDSSRTGVVGIALPASWHGVKTFRIKVFVIGRGRSVTLDSIRLQPTWFRPWQTPAQSYETDWAPHELTGTAHYRDGSSVTVTDNFVDTNSVVRTITPSSSQLTLTGAYRGQVSWDGQQRVLTTQAADYSVVLALPPGTSPVFYASLADAQADSHPSAVPGSAGAWQIELDTANASRVGIGFGTEAAGSALAARASEGNPWRGYYDDVLRRVPQPADFNLEGPTKGVTADAVRRMYYTSWVFVAGNVLPAQPEVGFGYPQVPTGKPSMWVEGAPGARATAQWDSLFGMQALAYLDPTTAWSSFEGLMSLVDGQGRIGGESLPVRQAQTALILYQVTGDAGRLRGIYPALRRHLDWARKNPRWIYGTYHDFPGEKDAAFVEHLLVDFRYAGDIAVALDLPAEVNHWQVEYDSLYKDYLDTFWVANQPTPYGTYWPAGDPVDMSCVPNPILGGNVCPGDTAYVVAGLHVPTLSGEPLTKLKALLGALPDGNRSFGGLATAKYPDQSHAIYGLLEKGMPDRAQVLANAVLRDITRTNFLAEFYTVEDPPRAMGVRPSLFGAYAVIDLVLLTNGYRMDRGAPSFVLMANEAGGVSGLTIRGRTLNLAIGDGISLSGDYVQPQCATLHPALGETVFLPTTCVSAEPSTSSG